MNKEKLPKNVTILESGDNILDEKTDVQLLPLSINEYHLQRDQAERFLWSGLILKCRSQLELNTLLYLCKNIDIHTMYKGDCILFRCGRSLSASEDSSIIEDVIIEKVDDIPENEIIKTQEIVNNFKNQSK